MINCSRQTFDCHVGFISVEAESGRSKKSARGENGESLEQYKSDNQTLLLQVSRYRRQDLRCYNTSCHHDYSDECTKLVSLWLIFPGGGSAGSDGGTNPFGQGASGVSAGGS